MSDTKVTPPYKAADWWAISRQQRRARLRRFVWDVCWSDAARGHHRTQRRMRRRWGWADAMQFSGIQCCINAGEWCGIRDPRGTPRRRRA